MWAMQTIIQKGWNDLAQTMPEEKHLDFYQGVKHIISLAYMYTKITNGLGVMF